MAGKFQDRIRVLGYGNFSKLESLMSRHFFRQLRIVSDETTEEPRTVEQLNKFVQDGRFSHVTIPDEHFHQMEGSLKGCCVPVIELLGDHWVPWAIEKKKNYMQENEVKHAFVFTGRFLEKYDAATSFHPVLFGYDDEIFTDKGMERDIDILISGTLGEDTHSWVYPTRNWLSQVLPEIAEAEGLKVEFLTHPGYFPQNGADYQSRYAQMLNRAKIATGGSSHWRLPLKKFFEIPACGATLLSDVPADDTNFFNGRIIEVDPEKTALPSDKDQLRRSVMTFLENYPAYKEHLQPFRTQQDRVDRSYHGRALEMRRILATIN